MSLSNISPLMLTFLFRQRETVLTVTPKFLAKVLFLMLFLAMMTLRDVEMYTIASFLD